MPKTVAIIGGGFTGMVAAYSLAKRGYKVALFERGTFLGGLASGFKINEQNLEKAYHHLFTTDTSMINLVKELNLEDQLLYCSSSMALYLNRQLYPFSSPYDLFKLTPLGFLNIVRFGIVTLYLKQTKSWQRFLKTPADAWLKKWYGPKAHRMIWKPLLKGKFHDYYQQVSMAWLWSRIHIRANSSEKGHEKLIYFKEGFQVIIDALRKKLDELGVEIQLESKIGSIMAKDNTPQLQFADGTIRNFGRVICTTPSHVFVQLAQNDPHCTRDYLDQLKSIQYLGAVLVIFSSPQSLSKYYWHNINDLESPFLVFIQHTNLTDKQYYKGDHVYYLGCYVPHEHRFFQQSESKLYQEFFYYLKKLFPQFQENEIREKYLFRFKNAQHVVDTQYEQKIPAYQTPLPGVYLSNFSQIFPEDRGTNFAVREGIKIANLVTNDTE